MTQVSIGVTGPRGRYELAARFLVGADGGHSVVRKLCGIEFPGITDHGFIARSGQVSIHPPVAVPGTGELDVAGVGRLRPATFTRTGNGMFTLRDVPAGPVPGGRVRVGTLAAGGQHIHAAG